MGYKVDYGVLDSWGASISGQASDWLEKLTEIRNKLQILHQSSYMAGQTADNLKNYIELVHMTLLGQLVSLVYLHNASAQAYLCDYQKNVDTNLHVRIVEEELDDIHEKIENTEYTAVRIGENLAYTMSGIKDIFTLSYNDVSEVETAHRVARNYVNNLHEQIKTLEKTHTEGDFVESEQLYQAIKNLIVEMQGKTRDFRSQYTPETTLASSAWGDLYNASVAVQETVQEKEEIFNEAFENQKERFAEYKAEEEAKEDRQWAKWVALGIAVVGSVALIVVTAGGASPGVCALWGAGVGLATTASSGLADEYVEHGNFDNMDWSEFGKDCIISTATGAIGGYAGGMAPGSAIQQPLKAGAKAATVSVASNLAEGVVDTTWDVGEAWINCQPGDEIKSIFWENVGEMGKETISEGLGDFAGGMVAQKFKVDGVKKNFGQQFLADTAENAAEALVKNGAESIWDVGTALVKNDESVEFSSVLKEEAADFLGGAGKDFVSEEIEDVVSGGIKAGQDRNIPIKNDKSKEGFVDTAEVIQNSIGDTVGKTAGSVAGGVVEQGVEVAFGERDSIDMKEIYEEELDGGRKIVKNAADSIAKNTAEKANEDKEFYNRMTKKADDNGNVQVMEFDKYKVLKEDVEAAKAVENKGAYKGKSVNDILGLPDNEKVDFENPEYDDVAITELEKSKYKTKKPTNAYTMKRATNATKEQYKKWQNDET